jgi:hypothetical protein
MEVTDGRGTEGGREHGQPGRAVSSRARERRPCLEDSLESGERASAGEWAKSGRASAGERSVEQCVRPPGRLVYIIIDVYTALWEYNPGYPQSTWTEPPGEAQPIRICHAEHSTGRRASQGYKKILGDQGKSVRIC